MLSKLKTLIPLESLEQEAQQQIYKELAHPFLKKLVIMPDCHTGYTLPIGGVALLDNVISPEYVGYDIGCGMCCVNTNIPISSIEEDGQLIFDEIYNKIPVGFNSHNTQQRERQEVVENLILEHFELDNSAPDIDWINKKSNK